MSNILNTTTSVCPVCLRRVSATITARADAVYLEKTCPDHGFFATRIWTSAATYRAWGEESGRPHLDAPSSDCCGVGVGAGVGDCGVAAGAGVGAWPPERDCVVAGVGDCGVAAGADALLSAEPPACPSGCVGCEVHLTRPCCVLFEVTQRCNLNCPVCYANAGSPGLNLTHRAEPTGSPGLNLTHRAEPTGSPASSPSDPSLESIAGWFDRLKAKAGICHIQLSGGEPTLRDDLPQIIRCGRERGFEFFQLNTNGLRLAADLGYTRELADAGLSCVFLQFDGISDAVYRRLRGRPLLDQKTAAIANCARVGLPVVLVPTVARGVNADELWPIIKFGLSQAPTVRGVHIQPLSFFGRCELDLPATAPAAAQTGSGGSSPAAAQTDTPRVAPATAPTDTQTDTPRVVPATAPTDTQTDTPRVVPAAAQSVYLTLPEVLDLLAEQSAGQLTPAQFRGGAAESAYCSFNANYLICDGRLMPVRADDAGGEPCCGAPTQSAGCGGPDPVAVAQDVQRRRWGSNNPPGSNTLPPRPPDGSLEAYLWDTRYRSFAITGMAFMDAFNLDCQRLRSCYIFVMSQQGELVPFCAYNLTNTQGQGLYR